MEPLKNNMIQARCFLIYATSPDSVNAKEAHRLFNAYIADPSRGISLYHDHFVGKPGGGLAIFYVENKEQKIALSEPGILQGWSIISHPLTFSRTPGSFDEVIAFTLAAYRGLDWEILRYMGLKGYLRQ